MCCLFPWRMKGDSFPQPLDRVAIAAMVVLSVITIVLLVGGDKSIPRVRGFSWQETTISSVDRAFTLRFNRPMNRETVESNLQIDPPLPGKISWAGERMAYTLLYPAPYGMNYTLNLSGARDRFADSDDTEHHIDPFEASFETRDRVMLYLGSEDGERGRLVLYNFSQDQKTILTPSDLSVLSFEMYPDGDRILFSALDRKADRRGLTDSQIYTVTTGLDFTSKDPDAPGRVQRILDNEIYQNLQFALAPDGTTIVVQRARRDRPGSDFGLWVIRDGDDPERFPTEPGGEFVIAPNSKELAIAQGQGVALLSIEPGREGDEPLQFFPQYGRVMGFTQDGRAAVMVKFNTDYTRSMVVVPNLGEPQEILRTSGSILDAEFDPSGRYIYALVTELLEADEYIEQPYLLALDLETQESQELIRFEGSSPDLSMSLAPDGQAILFDRLSVVPPNERPDAPLTSSGGVIEASELWILFPLVNSQGELTRPQPEQLPLDGFNPRWLP
ncbi:MAG: hypothetical protein HLUCCO16_17890 [Phormidium sp. OSCR]|nr:MAG: hypothetical protein HLUCCO16_17890 [Phormidium sp. OSCR]